MSAPSAELAALDATAQANLVREGEVTPGELVAGANPPTIWKWPRSSATKRCNAPR
jgi:hypothetical protein